MRSSLAVLGWLATMPAQANEEGEGVRSSPERPRAEAISPGAHAGEAADGDSSETSHTGEGNDASTDDASVREPGPSSGHAPTAADSSDLRPPGGNDRLRLRLASGDVVEGWFYAANETTLVLSGHNRLTRVDLAVVEAVSRNDVPISLDTFHAQLDLLQQRLARWRADPPPHPAPAVTAGLSCLWPGAGHAALGEWRSFWRYSAVELAFIATGAYSSLGSSPEPAVLVPLAALDLILRGTAVGDTLRQARTRRHVLHGDLVPPPPDIEARSP